VPARAVAAEKDERDPSKSLEPDFKTHFNKFTAPLLMAAAR
jgi:hypothetical protein